MLNSPNYETGGGMLSIPGYIGTSVNEEKHILAVFGNTQAFAS